MFYINQQLLLHGSKVTINWSLSPVKGVLVLWIPVSRYFWKNYFLVKNEGRFELIFSGKKFNAKIKSYSLTGIKTNLEINQEINLVNVQNLELRRPIIKSFKYRDFISSNIEISERKLSIGGYNNKLLKCNVKSNSINIKNINY
jgi:hypothetical protein